MATYLEKITAAQKGIDSTYGLLNIYKNSRSNNGWIGTNPSDINLSKFNTYFSENNIVKLNDSIDATLFDIPMSTRGYDKYGNFGAGIPSDIGFTRNVEQDENGKHRITFDFDHVSSAAKPFSFPIQRTVVKAFAPNNILSASNPAASPSYCWIVSNHFSKSYHCTALPPPLAPSIHTSTKRPLFPYLSLLKISINWLL